ncbi:MAG TPA: hypothetical protein VNO30_44670 [Kofleriaceae bacterium]|nr:hypothetical protein [Kofleriaceae bacterium]
MRPVVFVAAAASLVAAAPSDADACSPLPCSPGYFTPVNDAAVPANVPAFYWRPVSSAFSTPLPEPSDVLFARAAAPTTPLPFTAAKLLDGSYALTPQDPLTPGTDYVLTDRYKCGSMSVGPSVTFRALATAPQPTSLGTLTETTNLTGPITVPSSGGECSVEVAAHQVGIALQPSTDALAWRGALHYETFVDGQLWHSSSSADSAAPGSSWSGRGTDVLYAFCEEGAHLANGLAAGTHEVVMRATLPGTTTVVQSSALTVELACAGDGPDPDEGDGGCATGGVGGSRWLSLGMLAALAALVGRGHRAARRTR